MGEVLFLVQPKVSEETVELFNALAAAAARGDIIGAGVMVIFPMKHFGLDLAGAAKHDPTWIRGILAKFNDELAKLPANDE